MSEPSATASGLRPELAELIALREAVRAWPPARRAALSTHGPANSALRGRGMEYAESRPYSPGDEVRHIDWRVTARTGRAHTKLFHAERERVTLLVCDTDPRLYFGTRVRFKSVQAARAGALLAWAAQRAGDRVAALRGSRGEAPVAPAGGARGVLHVLGALTRWYAGPPVDDAGLDHALRHAARLLHPGARLLLLADPHGLQAVPDTRLAALSAHMDVACVLLADPLELDPPVARLPIQAAQRHELDLGDRRVRAAWMETFAARLDAVQARLARLRVGCRVLRSDDPIEPLLSLWQARQAEVA
ncbi:MAG: DUF58 domain-containing protein [Rehaibacterium terrae]|uniref:DUF58 domain-containing protein n=1 Tax=Rehaibacterium terrae TaxID=1341696 RepID=UPI0039187580